MGQGVDLHVALLVDALQAGEGVDTYFVEEKKINQSIRLVEARHRDEVTKRTEQVRREEEKVDEPSMFIAQLPQIPSLQDLLKVRVGSNSFLILRIASRTIGPHLLRSIE